MTIIVIHFFIAINDVSLIEINISHEETTISPMPRICVFYTYPIIYPGILNITEENLILCSLFYFFDYINYIDHGVSTSNFQKMG